MFSATFFFKFRRNKIYKTIFCLLKNSCYLHTTSVIRSKYNSKGPPWRILFFGNDDFSAKSLQLLSAKMKTQTIISKLDVVTTSKGRGINIRNIAKEEKLVTLEWPVSKVQLEKQYDIGVVVSFGRLIPEEIINLFPLGMINVHASLLPRWRGAAPIVYTILNGDLVSGVTIMKIHPNKFDVGEIVRQHSCAIDQHEMAKQLKEKLAEMGGNLLVECFKELRKNLKYAVPQPKFGITYAPKVVKSMAIVNWKTSDSKVLYDKFRALDGLYPLTTTWQGKQINLYKISCLHHIKNFNDSVEPGSILCDKKKRTLIVKCGGIGGFILVGQVKLSGHKTMIGYDFYSGFVSKKPEKERKFVTELLD
ncbi:methionyl-tRNA formyltransferase, mitochondrial-like isoform X3 [Daktulosphaira vitifoliae]|uniref:methionyl-tRNA formyltransferase, mitochondrial-like isoform X3 n=1 Tax=Daktulosphaira vitifoliae TaxID=58002 RepID=UPI0021AA5E0A|nr:methionyl-tRNA formyltransferase, mitochondrial-like isoform X3 [Daktulosphaira vitifoliae]